MAKKTLEELNLIDNFLFALLMTDTDVNEAFARKMVKQILGKEIGNVRVIPQKVIYGADTMYHGARLDVYIEESAECGKGEETTDIVEEAVYDIELEQNENKLAVRALPRRVRFYHAKIDAEALKTGESYDMLKKVYVIFIMPFDPFGCDRMIYTIKNCCVEEPELPYEDGATTLFLYTRGKVGVVPDGLREFLRFFEDTKEENAVNKDLMDMEEMVRHVKRNRKAGANYMKFYEEQEMIRREEHEAGLREGQVRHLVSLVIKKLRRAWSPDRIAEELEEDPAVIARICKVAAGFAPDYDEEKICADVLKEFQMNF